MEPQQPVFTVEPPGAPLPPRGGPPRAGGFVGGLTALLLVIWKFGGTLLSMLFMIWVYSGLFGWKLAAGIVLMIFVHEMGHVAAAVALKIPVSAPIFIPFIGASIVMKQNPRDALSEAIMAYAGPLAGGIGSWICLWAGQTSELPWLTAVAAFSFGINLFNLIPIPPLDGGRVCAAVSRWFWVLGVILLGLAVVYFHAWTILLIGGLVLFMAFRRIQDDIRYRQMMRQYYQIPFLTRVVVAIFYLGLAGALFVGLADASGAMPPVQAQGTYNSGP